MKSVIVLLADGFEECEALIVVDILRRAGVEVTMASINGGFDVTSSRGIVVRADTVIDGVKDSQMDVLFLPGGRFGTENLQKNETVLNLCRFYAKNRAIAAICAAPSILAGLGLLQGKKATCHPDYEDKMMDAVLIHNSVVVDGNIITGQGLGAAFLLSFELTSILVGDNKVRQIKKAICYRGE